MAAMASVSTTINYFNSQGKLTFKDSALKRASRLYGLLAAKEAT